MNWGSFKSLTHRAIEVKKKEGHISLARECIRYLSESVQSIIISSILKHLYIQLLPEYIEFSIAEIDGEFSTSIINHESSLDPINNIRHIYYTEYDVISRFTHDINEDDLFFDIGANLGVYSVFAGKEVDTGKIISFDPQPKITRALYQNLDRNCEKYELYQIAASDESGFAKMDPEFSAGSDIKSDSGLNVKTERMEEFIIQSETEAPTIVKIDVEGAEIEVLEGFGNLLTEIEILYIEIHSQSNEEIMQLLRSNFEKIEEVNRRGNNGQIHIRASSR